MVTRTTPPRFSTATEGWATTDMAMEGWTTADLVMVVYWAAPSASACVFRTTDSAMGIPTMAMGIRAMAWIMVVSATVGGATEDSATVDSGWGSASAIRSSASASDLAIPSGDSGSGLATRSSADSVIPGGVAAGGAADGGAT